MSDSLTIEEAFRITAKQSQEIELLKRRVADLETSLASASEIKPDTDFTKMPDPLEAGYYEQQAEAQDYADALDALANAPQSKLERELERRHAYYTPPGPIGGEFHKLRKEVEQLSKDRYSAQCDATKYKDHLHKLCAADCGIEAMHYAYDLIAKDAARHREDAAMKDKLVKQLRSMGLVSSTTSSKGDEGKTLAWALTEISTCIFGSPCNFPSLEAVVFHVKALKDAAQEYRKYKTMWESFLSEKHISPSYAEKLMQKFGISSSSQEKTPLRKEPLN